MNRLINAAIAFVLAGSWLAGCGSFSARPDPSKFFTLSALTQAQEAAGKDLSDSERVFLGIGPLKFPGYLDRQEIVTRTAEHRLEISENDRWAEPLDENFARVLSQNLAVLLPVERLVQYPWSSSRKPDVQVVLEVLRFEVNSGRDACLWARWEVLEAGTKTVFATTESRFTRKAKDGTTEAAVAALSEAGADLSREIAISIRSELQKNKLLTRVQ